MNQSHLRGPTLGSGLQPSAAMTKHQKQRARSIYEPGDHNHDMTFAAPHHSRGSTVKPEVRESTAVAYNRAVSVARQGGGTTKQRRNSFNSERDAGKDHQMTKKERYFFGMFKKKKKMKEESQWDSLNEADSARYFNLKHLFAKEVDPYEDTYKQPKSGGTDGFAAMVLIGGLMK